MFKGILKVEVDLLAHKCGVEVQGDEIMVRSLLSTLIHTLYENNVLERKDIVEILDEVDATMAEIEDEQKKEEPTEDEVLAQIKESLAKAESLLKEIEKGGNA